MRPRDGRTVPASGRCAIRVPLALVKTGISWSLGGQPAPSSGHMGAPEGTDSQADSAGSIPVTRSQLDGGRYLVTEELKLAGFVSDRPQQHALQPCLLKCSQQVGEGPGGADWQTLPQ